MTDYNEAYSTHNKRGHDGFLELFKTMLYDEYLMGQLEKTKSTEGLKLNTISSSILEKEFEEMLETVEQNGFYEGQEQRVKLTDEHELYITVGVREVSK